MLSKLVAAKFLYLNPIRFSALLDNPQKLQEQRKYDSEKKTNSEVDEQEGITEQPATVHEEMGQGGTEEACFRRQSGCSQRTSLLSVIYLLPLGILALFFARTYARHLAFSLTFRH
jgi:hypothetical protein